MSGIAEDLRFSIRLMARLPAFTCVVVITLALGIGANSAIFSIVNSFILRPLPFDNPEELVYLGEYCRDGRSPSARHRPAGVARGGSGRPGRPCGSMV